MSSAIYEDIPRIYTAIIEWSACIVYLSFMRKKAEGVWYKMAVGTLLLLQIVFLEATGNLPVQLWIPCMMGAVGMMYLLFRLSGVGNQYCSIYYTAKAFLLAEFTASLGWQIIVYFKASGFNTGWLNLCLLAMISVLILSIAALIEKKIYSEAYIQQLTWREVLLAVGIVTVIFAFGNLSFIYTNLPFGGRTRADIFNVRTMTDLIGLLVLILMQQRISQYLAEKEMNAIQRALKSQYQQYRGMQDSIEFIHIKCHDLKHQIAGLRAAQGQEERKEWLDTLEKEVDIYQSFQRTGNAVLDTILTGKILQCKKNDIRITSVIDGQLLNMLHVTDICTIFGNALDNAIESVCMIQEPEKRLIHLSVNSYKNFVGIMVENYCENVFAVEKGKLPNTTKSDTENHGYGMKSIRFAVEHYGGSMSWSAEDNWFKLSILIPQKKDV